MRWQSGLGVLLHLHLHMHLLGSCMLRLLCLSEAEDLQLVVFTVKLDIMCLWLCTGSYNISLAVMCGLSRSSQALYST